MSNFKVIRHERNFLQIDHEVLFNKELSFKAKGLLATCLAFPPNWNHNISHLSKLSTNGKDSIYSCIDELIEHGYCHRYQENKGKFSRIDYFFYETKSLNPYLNKSVPHRGFPDTEYPHRENPPLLRNTLNKKKKEVVLSVEGEPPSSLKKAEDEDLPKVINKFGTDGVEDSISLEDVYRVSISKKKDWLTSEIVNAWKILLNYEGRVNNLWRFIEGTIENIRKKENFEKVTNNKKLKGKEWKKTHQATTQDVSTMKELSREEALEHLGTMEQHSPLRDYINQIKKRS